MDFYKLSAKMRKARRQYSLSAGAQALFYELMAICNEERWPDVFKCPNGELCSAISCAEKSLIQYRDELAAAEMVQYQSGKSKRQPCSYSLNGCLIGLPNGLLNGGKIYSSLDSQSGSHSGEKTTDLLKQKSNTEEKDFIVDDDVKSLARKNEIESAIVDFASNASFDPQRTHLPEEKEKNSAKKEKKPLPTLQQAMAAVCETAFWRNVLEHHKITEAEREDCFRIFYEQREDTYLIRLPTWLDVVQHFYNWVPIHQMKPQLKNLMQNANAKASTHATGNTKSRSTGDRIERNNGIADIISQSEEFLQQHTGY